MSASKEVATVGEVGTLVESGGSPKGAELSPLQLVQLSIERGVEMPVDVLERLVALDERMKERRARELFYAALGAFQQEMPPIRKMHEARIASKTGAGFKYLYAPLEDITEAIRDLLGRHGFSYTWDSKVEGKTIVVDCILRHIDGHETRATFTGPTESSSGASDIQKVGAALTYGRRQSLIQVLGLTTADKDTDGRDPADVDAISIQDLRALEGRIDAIQRLADSKKVRGLDVVRFLRMLGVDRLAALPKGDLPKAEAALARREQALQKKEETPGEEDRDEDADLDEPGGGGGLTEFLR